MPSLCFLWEFLTALEQALWPFLLWSLGPPLHRLKLKSSPLLGWWRVRKMIQNLRSPSQDLERIPGLTDSFITGARGLWHGQCPQLQSLLSLPLLLDSVSVLSISACGTPPRGHSILLARVRAGLPLRAPNPSHCLLLTAVRPASPG